MTDGCFHEAVVADRIREDLEACGWQVLSPDDTRLHDYQQSYRTERATARRWRLAAIAGWLGAFLLAAYCVGSHSWW